MLKTSINIASFSEDGGSNFPRKQTLLKTLESLKGQADIYRVYFNGVMSRPEWIPKWVEVYYFMDNNLTDLGKFYFLEPGIEEYYFSADDDIRYPRTYVKDMVEAIERYKCIVTHHGRELIPGATSYYRGHPAMRCLGYEPKNKELDVAGTGVTAFDTRYFNPYDIKRSPIMKASDLVYSVEAAKQGKEILGLAHSNSYFMYLNPPVETTIHQTESKSQARLIKLANDILKIKGKI